MAVHDLIERVQVLDISPGDVLVVKLSDDAYDDDFDALTELAEQWREAMPGHRVVIHCGEMELSVIRAGE